MHQPSNAKPFGMLQELAPIDIAADRLLDRLRPRVSTAAVEQQWTVERHGEGRAYKRRSSSRATTSAAASPSLKETVKPGTRWTSAQT